MTIAPSLFVIGLVLMAGEILVPGGILGSIGAMCFLAASVDIWITFGSLWGLLSVIASMAIGLALFFLEVRMMRSGPLARWFYLSQKTPPTPSKSAGGIAVGTVGKAITRLNPTGLVMVGERRLEAISREGLIEEGTEIVIVNDDPFRVVVARALRH
jgi:membrane-bound ClpP family serine protease